jgi:hypothetical protein
MTKTFEFASKLVSKEASGPSGYRIKELGLNLVLFGLAEQQALRLAKISTYLNTLEDKLFTEERLEELQPAQIMDLYRQVKDSLGTSYNYVKSVTTGLNWTQMEASLLAVQAEDTRDPDGSTNLSKIAREVLAKLGQIQEKPNG